MLEFVYQDRWGYKEMWEVIEARDPRHAVRKSSNLDDAAEMLEFVYQDRWGYWEVVEARDPRHAVRKSSNLDDAADLTYATTSCVGLLSVVGQQSIERNNAKVRAGYA